MATDAAASLTNPVVCGDGTVYNLFGQDGRFQYVLLGSEDPRHRWDVKGEEASRRYVNAATLEEVDALPCVEKGSRPYDVSALPLARAVAAFYAQYNAAKVEESVHVVARYVDKQGELLRDLYGRYNQALYPFEAELYVFYAEHCPDKIANVPVIAREWDARRSDLWDTLRQRYPHAAMPAGVPAAAAGGAGALRQKLTDFFNKHNPAKLGNIDTIVTTYAGREDELWAALHKTYNLPPPDASPAQNSAEPQPQAAQGGDGALRQKLADFFNKHNPAKLGNIDMIVTTYAGREDELWAALHKTYNLPPPAAHNSAEPQPQVAQGGDGALRQKLTDFFNEHNPAKLGNIDTIVTTYAGREDELWAALHKTYNLPPPAAPSMPAQNSAEPQPQVAQGGDGVLRQKLTEFFNQHNPAKLGNIDAIVTTYAGREDELWAALHKTYNVSAAVPPDEAPAASPPTPPPPPQSDNKIHPSRAAYADPSPDNASVGRQSLSPAQAGAADAPPMVEDDGDTDSDAGSSTPHTGAPPRQAPPPQLPSTASVAASASPGIRVAADTPAAAAVAPPPVPPAAPAAAQPAAALERSLALAKARLGDGRAAVRTAEEIVAKALKDAESAHAALAQSRARERDLLAGLTRQQRAARAAAAAHAAQVADLERRLAAAEEDSGGGQRVERLEDSLFRLRSDLMHARFADLPRGHCTLSDDARERVPPAPPAPQLRRRTLCEEKATATAATATATAAATAAASTQTKMVAAASSFSPPPPPPPPAVLATVVAAADQLSTASGSCGEGGGGGGGGGPSEEDDDDEVEEEERAAERGARAFRASVARQAARSEWAAPPQLHLVRPETHDVATATEPAEFPAVAALQRRLDEAGGVRVQIAREVEAVTRLVDSQEERLAAMAQELAAHVTPAAAVAAAAAVVAAATPAPAVGSRAVAAAAAARQRHGLRGRQAGGVVAPAGAAATAGGGQAPPLHLLDELGRLHLLHERVRGNAPASGKRVKDRGTDECRRAALSCIRGN